MELRFLEVNGEKRLQVKCGLMTDEWEDVPIMKEAKNYSSEAPFKAIIKELRTRVAELESRLEAGCRDDEKQCVFLSEREELKKRVAELEDEKKLTDTIVRGTTFDKYKALLKASEGLEKALEKIAEKKVEFPEYDWSDWNGGDAHCETQMIIALEVKQALADFRAIKETMEKGAGK